MAKHKPKSKKQLKQDALYSECFARLVAWVQVAEKKARTEVQQAKSRESEQTAHLRALELRNVLRYAGTLTGENYITEITNWSAIRVLEKEIGKLRRKQIK